MAPVYKIAVVQMFPKPLDPETNHATAISHIRAAASQSCDLVVLPEYHLTAWVPDSPEFIPVCSTSSKYLASYQSLASSLGICIVPGTIVEKHSDTLHNIAYFISHDGSIMGSYQKKNLWHPERPHLTSSKHVPHEAIPTPLGKIGLLICWDLAFPEAFRQLITSGAKLIIIPTFWGLEDAGEIGLKHNPHSETLLLESMIISRCFENTCAVVFANGGDAGLSQVTVPFKGALGKMGKEEGMCVVDVDMQILEEAEENYKVREDVGSEGWHYDYSLVRNEGEGGK